MMLTPVVKTDFPSFSAYWTHLKEHPVFQKSPLLAGWRSLLWWLRCLFNLPTIITLPRWRCRFYLPAKRHQLRWHQADAMTFYVSREDYEPGLRYLERVLSPGQVFVDGGANLGIYTIVAAKLVGPQGQVLAFEPRPEAFTTLQCSVALNQLSNTKIFYKALSDHEGKFLLNSRETAVEVKEEMQVDTTTIDLALLDEGISQVDVLRLDVEGFEELVLRGAREMLRRHSPVILFSMSQAPERLRLASDGAWQLLKSLGYEFYTLGNHRELVELYTPRFGQTIAIKNQ